MPSKRIVGLIATLSVVAGTEAATARPCLIGPDERPVASRDPAPVGTKAARSVHRHVRTPAPCEPVAASPQRMPRGPKPAPVMLGPQRDDR